MVFLKVAWRILWKLYFISLCKVHKSNLFALKNTQQILQKNKKNKDLKMVFVKVASRILWKLYLISLCKVHKSNLFALKNTQQILQKNKKIKKLVQQYTISLAKK